MEKYPPLNEAQKLELFNEAMNRNVPVVFAYEGKEGLRPRAVQIDRVSYNAKGELYINGMDSLSMAVRSFTAAKMQTPHLLAFAAPINTEVAEEVSDNYQRMFEQPASSLPPLPDDDLRRNMEEAAW